VGLCGERERAFYDLRVATETDPVDCPRCLAIVKQRGHRVFIDDSRRVLVQIWEDENHAEMAVRANPRETWGRPSC
jgi:hypothetical protein